jgi:hypothetical protein
LFTAPSVTDFNPLNPNVAVQMQNPQHPSTAQFPHAPPSSNIFLNCLNLMEKF